MELWSRCCEPLVDTLKSQLVSERIFCDMFLPTRRSWILHIGLLSWTLKAATCTLSSQDLHCEFTSLYQNVLIVYSGSDGFPSTKQALLSCQPTELITNQNGMCLFNVLTIICKSWKGHLRSMMSLESLLLLLNAPHVMESRPASLILIS